MELKEQLFAPTLARKLGDTTHLSPLLHKIQRLSGCSKDIDQWLLKAAVERGASHYRREFSADLPPDVSVLKNEEIGAALCLGHLPDDPTLIRAAAQLLSSPNTNPELVARLAVMERCEDALLYIAECCEKVDLKMEPWESLRRLLRHRKKVPPDILPHVTRFVSMTGLTRNGRGKIDWLVCHD